MAQQVSNGEGHLSLLQKLHPVLELTPVVRPRLLLAASSSELGPILLGLLYHAEKNAYQSRLRFRVPSGQEFLRRTKWRRFAAPQTLLRRQEQISRGFNAMTARIGGGVISQLEFAATASDDDILRLLLASPIPALFGE